jgi:hypothetical protein
MKENTMSDGLKDTKAADIPGTMEDLRNVKKFWDHYKIPIREDDLKWVGELLNRKDDSLSIDEKKRIQFLIAFGHCTDTEVFKDDVFTKTNENSKKIVYEYQFNEDVDKMLTGEG